MSGLKLERYRIRLACNALTHSPMSCILQASTPTIWKGVDVQVEVGLFWGTTILGDISNLSSLTLNILDNSDRDGTPLVEKVIAGASLKADMTSELWTAGLAASCHASFNLTNAELNLDVSGTTSIEQKKQFWMVIHGTTNDTPARYITYGGTLLTIEEDGAQNGLSVVTAALPSVRLVNGDLQVWNPITLKYHKVFCNGPAGAVGMVVEQTGEAS